MAIYNWSSLINGTVFGGGGANPPSFNRATDTLAFDDASISAADMSVDSPTGLTTIFSYGGKTVTLNTSPFTLTQTSVTFQNGSLFLVGDNTTATVNDDAANTLTGGAFNDFLVGAGGADSLSGGGGNDFFGITGDDVNGIYGNDTLNGGPGIDTLFYIDASSGVTLSLNGSTPSTATGGDGSSTLTLLNIENVIGTAYDDSITGSGAANYFEGRDGADTLSGGGTGDSASDTLLGGAGDDRLIQTLGSDSIIGGDGQDILTFNGTAIPGPVNVNLFAGTSTAAGSSATISGIEHVFGTAANDTFTGGDPLHAPIQENGEAEIFRPAGGNDTITGAAGHGWITAVDYSTAVNPVTVTLGDSDNLGTASGADIGIDTLVNVDWVRGGSGNDTLTGGSYATSANGNFNEHFRGNAGNDTINGQGSDTTLGSIGDNDIAEYQNSPFAVVVNLGTSAVTGTPYGTVAAGTARDGWDSGGGGTDTLIGIDVVFGSANNDTLVAGGPDPNTNERLDGRAGNDNLVGGVSGTDEADYSNDPAAVLVDLGLGTVTDGYGGTDTLVAINWTRGSDFNDTIVGGNNNERLMGGRGDDSIDGGGTNGVSYAGYQIAVSGVNAFVENGSGTASDGQGGNDTLVNINGLWGGNFNDTLTGGLGDQWFRGRGGSDTIDGGGGIDTVVYRDPNPAGVTVNLSTNSATDGWGGSWNLQGTDTLFNIENVEGSDFKDNITGDANANRLEGLGGNDTLNGGAGNDTMVGGTGNDTYVRNAVGDVVTEAASAGTDTVQSAVAYTLGANVENLTLTGAGAINGTGNTLNNLLTGNTANNLLNGGTGNDTMVGGLGNDTYVRNAAGDVVTEAASAGIDTVQSAVTYTLGLNVENLTLTGAGAINGTGNTLNNLLTGNTANNTLNGGIGNDTMAGGLGNDTYVRNAAGDVVTEAASVGIDTVQSAVTYTLGANLENLALTGAAAINGIGNTLANVLTGNTANNILNGGAGADTLNGGNGNDTLVWDALDVSVNGAAGTDTLRVDGATALNLTTVSDTKILNVEVINLAGTNTLTLSLTDVLAISSSTDILTVDGAVGDTVHRGAGWTQGADQGGYYVYTQGLATLLVDADITSVV